MLMFHVDILVYSQQVLKFNTMKLKFIADMILSVIEHLFGFFHVIYLHI